MTDTYQADIDQCPLCRADILTRHDSGDVEFTCHTFLDSLTDDTGHRYMKVRWIDWDCLKRQLATKDAEIAQLRARIEEMSEAQARIDELENDGWAVVAAKWLRDQAEIADAEGLSDPGDIELMQALANVLDHLRPT